MSMNSVTTAIVTPTYAPDLPLFAELHQSVLKHTSESTVHHVVVSPRDLALFRQFAGPRCRVLTIQDLLPSTFIALPGRPLWVHRRRPLPPVRGWVMQQVLKVAATAALDVDAALVVDSDVVLVRDVDPARLRDENGCSFYRLDGAVDVGMERHVLWHKVARRLLGVAPADPPLPDYVTPFNVWDPEIVRAMQRRVEEVTGRSWVQVMATQLHVSEFILYGVFVDAVLKGGCRARRDSLGCREYWDDGPLDEAGGRSFAARFGPDHLAVMVSAKSTTPSPVRELVLSACRARAANRQSS